MVDSMQQVHRVPGPRRAVSRHAAGPEPRPVEVAGWLASWLVSWLVFGARRWWRWVWSVDHDDVASTIAAWLLQFALLATLFLVTVIGAQ